MEIAKITAKGQITVPIEVRRKLGVKEGDKVLFVEEAGRMYVLNASMAAVVEAQTAFAGEANRAGLRDHDDIVAMVKQFRRERSVKQE